MATPAKMSRGEDSRLALEQPSAWQKEKHPLQGSRYELIDSNTRVAGQPTVLEFDLPTNQDAVLCGPMTHFVVRGGFEKRAAAVAGVAGEWVPTVADDAEKVVLAPNWFEMLIKQTDVFCNNTRITSSNEARFVTPFLNAFLYRLLEPKAKAILGPQETHFTHCVPPWTANQWGAVEATHGDTWLKHGKKLFAGGGKVFDYQPLFVFPFHPGASDEDAKLLPVNLTGRIQIRITFHDSQAHIFRRVAANTDEYRFTFTYFRLMVEVARLSPAIEKSLASSKRLISYPGLTRLQQIDPVPEGASTFKTRFQDIFFPEALLIFALPKEVASGTYKFSTDTGQNVFQEHRISEVQVAFDHKRLHVRDPFPGEINEPWFEYKQYLDHIYHPIFGLLPDRSAKTGMKFEHFVQGGARTSYPHVYLSLVNFNTKHRQLPAMESDASAISKRADLDIELTFTEEGTKANLIYVTYAIYSDVAVTYDTRTRLFGNPYNVIFN